MMPCKAPPPPGAGHSTIFGTELRMINTLSILASLLGCIFVVVRAVMLDKTLPWFAPVPETPPAAKLGAFKLGVFQAAARKVVGR